MVRTEDMKEGLGAELVAFDAFLSGIPEGCVVVKDPESVFQSLVDKETGETLPLLARFVQWQTAIPANDLIMAMAGDHHLTDLINFVGRFVEGKSNIIVGERIEKENLERLAVICGNLPITKSVICDLPEDMHFTDEMIDAARLGYLAMVKFLLDEQNGEKANIHAKCDEALRCAAGNGHLNVVKFLLDERDGDRATIHAESDGALRWAAEDGHLSVVKFLLDTRDGEKADIHADNNSALYQAARNNHSDVVKYLLEKGAVLGEIDVLTLANPTISISKGDVMIVDGQVLQPGSPDDDSLIWTGPASQLFDHRRR